MTSTRQPDIEALRCAIDGARIAMRTAIEARAKSEIVHTFVGIRNSHAELKAVEIYFGETKNIEARRQAREVRLGAERTMGQWLIELMERKLRSTGRPGTGAKVGTPSDANLITLEELGIDRNASFQFQAVAKLSSEEFAALVADDTATSALFRQVTEARSSSGKLKFHPLADVFPLMLGPEFGALVADIKANGQREPIVLFEGEILDGRNRWRACKKAGIEPKTKVYRGKDPLAFVISMNLQRRHLNESQRAMVAAKIANMRQGERTDLEPSANLQKVAQDDAAKMLNVSTRSTASARTVLDKGDRALQKAVEQGHLPVSAAAQATKLPSEQQRQVAQEAAAGRANVVRKTIKQGTRQVREAELGHAQAAGNLALPTKRYGVILADPEWRFEPYSRETGMDRAADNHYPTSSTDVIASRPVQTIAADDCVLFLWATVPMLPDAFAVMSAWGFKYVTTFTWRKDKVGTGYWNRNRCEHLLVGIKGKIPGPAQGTQFASIIDGPVRGHSEKPDWQYNLIEAYFPTLRKIELNARARRPGWDAWGNEAPDVAADSPTMPIEVPLSPDENSRETLDHLAFDRCRRLDSCSVRCSTGGSGLDVDGKVGRRQDRRRDLGLHLAGGVSHFVHS